MNKEKKNTPIIRFKGFSDDWEQRKFGLLFEKNLEKNKNSEFDASRTISIATMHFKEEGNGAAESSLATYKVLRVGDIAYEGHTSKQFAFGRFVLNDIGDGIMSPRFTTLRPTSERPISFWKQYIHYEPIMRHLLVRSTKNGTMMNELVIPDLEKESLLVPSESEQKQIGAFFDKLDETIALHQRKLEQLKRLKQGFLQVLFANDTNVPRMRFAGFTEEWEQRKIGDVFSERSERSGEGELISVTIQSGVVKASELDRRDNSSDNKSNYKKVEIGDIAYNSMRMWQGASGYSPYNGILSPAYTVLTPKEDVYSKFFAYDFKRYDMIQLFKRNSQGLTSDTWNLKFPTLQSVKVMVPSIEEQKKISTLFESFDTNIAFYQLKIEQLKKLKKSFLQKMFI